MTNAGDGSRAFSLEPVSPGHWLLAGDLGIESAAAILARGESEFSDQSRVELDLAGVTDADSAGLAVLIEWTRSACQGGRCIAFRSMPSRLKELARIGGVDELLP